MVPSKAPNARMQDSAPKCRIQRQSEGFSARLLDSTPKWSIQRRNLVFGAVSRPCRREHPMPEAPLCLPKETQGNTVSSKGPNARMQHSSPKSRIHRPNAGFHAEVKDSAPECWIQRRNGGLRAGTWFSALNLCASRFGNEISTPDPISTPKLNAEIRGSASSVLCFNAEKLFRH